jgi:hypothetical protein
MTQIQRRRAEALIQRNQAAIERARSLAAGVRESSARSDDARRAIHSALRRAKLN